MKKKELTLYLYSQDEGTDPANPYREVKRIGGVLRRSVMLISKSCSDWRNSHNKSRADFTRFLTRLH